MRSTISWIFVLGVVGTFGLALLAVGLGVSQARNVFEHETFNAGLAIIGFSTVINFLLGIRVYRLSNLALDKRYWSDLSRGELFAVLTALLSLAMLGGTIICAITAFVARLTNPHSFTSSSSASL